MGTLRGKYAIAGVALSRFGKVPGVSPMGFTLEASKRAVEDAGVRMADIDGLLVVMPAALGEQHGWAARVAAYLGLDPSFCSTVDMGGATACGAVHMAMAAIEAGYCSTVLCAFGTQTWPQGVALQLFGSEFHLAYGDVGAICFSGFLKRRQQVEYGLPDELYGRVAVTCRSHAQLNEEAQMQKPMTLEDYFASRWVAEPLRLFDCCPNTDGGGAIVVTSVERARDLRQPVVRVIGVGQEHRAELVEPKGNGQALWGGMKAAARAYAMAGIRASDLSCVQFYDAFTPRVVNDLVAYGLAAPEELDAAFARGDFALGGRVPCNTAGGLLSEGHLWGFGHVREGVRQLRGECGKRQVAGARICLVTGYGGAPHESPPTVSYSALVLARD
ncbi:MAG: thiolase family protein [Candidatus Binatia bacterium]|nr:thiolase family protein [Candidatus Binatia bacterium]